MKKYLFPSLEEARLFCKTQAKKNLVCEIFERERRRRRKRFFKRKVSYLRKVRRSKRRVRVSYFKEYFVTVTEKTKVFEVVLTPFTPFLWLPTYLEKIRREYGITVKNVDYPAKYLKWVHQESLFWSWIKRFPPYSGLGYFVKVQVWAVVVRDEGGSTEETFIWSWSRSRGLDYGISWEDAVSLKNQIQHDVLKLIGEKEDYLTLHEFIGWSAYPQADWYYKTFKSKSKRSLAQYFKTRKPKKRRP